VERLNQNLFPKLRKFLLVLYNYSFSFYHYRKLTDSGEVIRPDV